MENNLENVNEGRIFVVYKHTTPSNKVYIGITRQNPPEKRWGYNGAGYKDNVHFWNAISKYSWQNIKHEILYTNLTKEEAEQKEIELIALYDANNPDKGYNMTLGGGYSINVVFKPVKQYTVDGEFIREYDYIKYASNETGVSKGSISMCCNNRLKTAGGYIWRFSEDELTEEYLIWCNSDKKSENCIPVHQYNMDGEFIKEYKGMTVASLATGASLISILFCCRGEYKSVANSIWRYAWEELTEEHLIWCNKSPQSQNNKKVNQYLIDGTFVCTYESIGEASLKTGINRNGIGGCCRNRYKISGGYIWRFFGDEITHEYLEWCNSVEKKSDDSYKSYTAVIQYALDGNFVSLYKSLSEAERKTGISCKGISDVCKGTKEQFGGYIWRCASNIQNPYAPLFPTLSDAV